RSSPARGAVVRLARTKDEVTALIRGILRWPEEFDVVDFAGLGAGDAFAFERLPNTPSEIGKSLDLFQFPLLSVVAHQEKPVAPPSDVAGDAAVTFDLDGHSRGVAIARHVFQGDGVRPVVVERHDAARRIQFVPAGCDSPEMPESHADAD